jgi:hypothetical protein
MISGVEVVVYSKHAEADRAFFRDGLGFRGVDAGNGWLIFALPPAEIACHPAAENGKHEIYLMCEDLAAMETLQERKIECDPAKDVGWGLLTTLTLPGGRLGLRVRDTPLARRC